MTQHELYREIQRIDGFIEVLQNLISNPLCKCMTHVNTRNDNFTKENKEHLQILINIRNFLLPLKGEPDTVLAEVNYKPVVFTC